MIVCLCCSATRLPRWSTMLRTASRMVPDFLSRALPGRDDVRVSFQTLSWLRGVGAGSVAACCCTAILVIAAMPVSGHDMLVMALFASLVVIFGRITSYGPVAPTAGRMLAQLGFLTGLSHASACQGSKTTRHHGHAANLACVAGTPSLNRADRTLVLPAPAPASLATGSARTDVIAWFARRGKDEGSGRHGIKLRQTLQSMSLYTSRMSRGHHAAFRHACAETVICQYRDMPVL